MTPISVPPSFPLEDFIGDMLFSKVLSAKISNVQACFLQWDFCQSLFCAGDPSSAGNQARKL
jgi:hypothetical protein